MITWLIGLLAPRIGARFAKPVAVGIIVVVAALAAFLLWRAFIGGIIKRHDLEQDAAVIENTAAANTNAADERATDATRVRREADELKEAVHDARANGDDPRAAYYRCVQLQQSARASGDQPPEC